MRRLLPSCALLILLAAASALSQPRQYSRVWYSITPEGEEFAVHMPEPNFRIRREIPFGDKTLKPASFEVTNRGTLFSVLSFSKSEPGAPKSLDAFVKGFRQALVKGTGAVASDIGFDSAKRQLKLKSGDAQGAARVFETDQHFYVVLTYGSAADAGTIEHFFNSFTLDTVSPNPAPLSDMADVLTSSVKAPAPLWPVADGNSILVGIGTSDSSPSPNPAAVRGRTIITGGVLNGKALAKPAPTYPPIAKAARASGVVTVQIVVDEEGYVISADAVSGHPLLQHSAAIAARQARFTPTKLEGQPVKVSGVITYNFVLQ